MVAEGIPQPDRSESSNPADELVPPYADCDHRLESYSWTDSVCEEMSAAVDELAAIDPVGDEDAVQLGRLHDIGRVIDRLEAERLRLLQGAHTSGVIERDGGARPSTWLRRSTSLTAGQAATRGRVAARLAGLPVIAAALADGVIGVAHADHIDRLARDTDLHQVERIQQHLVEAAVHMRDLTEFGRLCIGLRHALRPEALDERDEAAYDNRRLSAAATMDGVVVIGGCLDAEGGAHFLTALDAFTVADPEDTPPELRRSADQRRADALVHMAKAALRSTEAPTVAGQRPHVTLRATAEGIAGAADAAPAELDRVGPIGLVMALRILGDSVIARLLVNAKGQPLDVGTATRVWPAGIRRAITDRDRGCRFAGCGAPITWCDIDHVKPWQPDENGERGPTAYHNGILLCGFHHRRAKHPDRWWPTLHDDGTVTWKHADGRVRISHPPDLVDRHVQQTLQAELSPPGDPPDTYGRDVGDAGDDRSAGEAPGDDTAGETRARYDTEIRSPLPVAA